MNPEALAAFDLTGRVAVVTGAASGIGRASASLLGAAGAAVLCADLDLEGAEATATQLVEAGARALSRRVDVTAAGALDDLVDAAVTELGGLDVMANVAGIILQAPVVDFDDPAFERIMAVNLTGVFRGCRAAAR